MHTMKRLFIKDNERVCSSAAVLLAAAIGMLLPGA